MANTLDLLATDRIAGLTEEITQEYDRVADADRLFSSWVPDVPAEDGEVMARIKSGYFRAADLIQVDQKAVVITPEPIRLTQSTIPKIKHGQAITEAMMILLRRIMLNLVTTRNREVFDNYVANSLRDLIDGVRDRKEIIFAAMMVDNFTYNRYGIRMDNLSWGTPAALKTTPTVLWSDATNGLPITDLRTAMRYRTDVYGEPTDILVMSTKTFDYACATVQFRTLAPGYAPILVTASTLPTSDPFLNMTILQRMVAQGENPVRIIINDKRTRIPDDTGATATARFLPENKVILSAAKYVNNSAAWDFADAVNMETMAGTVPLIIGGDFAQETSGVVGYATSADPHGNPPGEILWSVERGFPRKHNELATSVITAW